MRTSGNHTKSFVRNSGAIVDSRQAHVLVGALVKRRAGRIAYLRIPSEFDSAAVVQITAETLAVRLQPRIHEQKKKSLERINSIRETKRYFDSCNSCERLDPSRLHKLHESKCPFASRIEFIRPNLSNLSAHVSGSPLGICRASVSLVRPYSLRPNLVSSASTFAGPRSRFRSRRRGVRSPIQRARPALGR